MDNLSLASDAQVNHLIGVVRSTEAKYSLADELRLAPGAFFSIDPDGKVSGHCAAGGSNVLSVEYSVEHPVKWFGLHFSMGGIDLRDAAVFGVVCKSRSPEATTLRVCLRSPTPDGFVDAFLPKHVVAYGQASTHVDLMKLEGREDVPSQAAWRELILFFPTQSAAIDLIDLRVFVV